MQTALGIIAINIKKFWDYQRYPASIDVIITEELLRNPSIASDYDVIFPMYYVDAIPLCNIIGKNKIITGIHSHNLWDNDLTTPERDVEPPDELCNFLNSLKGINVVSKRLLAIFSSKIKNIKHTRCGVDTHVFFKINIANNDTFVVGWVGNTRPDYQRGAKGFYDIVLPLSKVLQDIKFSFIDWSKTILSHEQMNDFYNSIDILINASIKEGQPMPPVEAAACGVPTISTNVGIIPELITNGKNGYIIDRDINAFAQTLNHLQSNRSLLEQMRINCMSTISKSWKWELVIDQWMRFIYQN